MKTKLKYFLWVHTDKPKKNRRETQPLEVIVERLRERGVQASVCQRQI